MITDEDRQKLGDLAMRAIDSILDQYGEDATLEDAVLIFEVSRHDPDLGERVTEINGKTTTHRAAVVGGITAAYAVTQLTEWGEDE